ncbi:DgyrCDS547 [Dimorphilus gyrociliatus]|uniref:DgyrCDS547 n=1 Tax=Dimorphilus gyrociliatus TaxID=2664684 RepID=A0A7I8V4R8_9ANNE|nr:DgyrCDS547 [Dimorphilus gyrociliatus]
MDLEEAFKETGEFGKGQKKLFFMTMFLHMFCAFNTLQHVLVGAKPEHFACIEPNLKNIHQPCNQTCNKYTFPGEFYTTIAHEWSLVCSNRYKIEMSGSIYMGGLMAGCLIFGFLSDKYGRRLIMLLVNILSSLFLYSAALSFNYYMYAVCRFFNGVFIGGAILVSFVVLTESVGSGIRGSLGVLCAAAFAVGISIFGFIGYFIYNWRLLIIITGLPGLFLSVYFYIKLLESPRWLLSCGRVEDAENVMEVIARRNGKKVAPIKLKKPETNNKKSINILTALKIGKLRTHFLILVFNWFVNSLVYYGLSMGSGNFSPNIYINEGLGGLIELPAYVLVYLLLDRLGRKILLAAALIISAVSSFVLFFLTYNNISNWTTFGLATIGKLMISGSFCIAYIYSAELFPTIVRSNLMGLCSVAARIGGMIAPLMPTIKYHQKNSPQWLLYFILCLIAGIGVFFLQETCNKPTINTLEDVIGQSNSRPNKAYYRGEDEIELLNAEEMAGENA